jgi:hypothetical protein
MNLTDADAMEPDAGSGAGTEECATRELAPHAATILAGGQGFVEEPGGEKEQAQKVEPIEEMGHGIPFP